ncbi:SCP-like protein [Necator americanus]|uniref:SCP-like protein n=1 Tax=Necator americanus TaxID=51031 RepID=W2TZG9_NECAM|nr:SCP-like protein [Necator americanus]ETN86461.1 SCP-like protein [Necator americanus]
MGILLTKDYQEEVDIPQSIATSTGICRMSQEERTSILDLHNVYRAQLAQGNLENNGYGYAKPAALMFILQWDCELENMAYEHATRCLPQKSDPETRPNVGENVYISMDQTYDHKTIAKQALNEWWNVLAQFGIKDTRYTEELNKSSSYASWSQVSE